MWAYPPVFRMTLVTVIHLLEKQPSDWDWDELETFAETHRYDDNPDSDTVRLLRELYNREQRE